uniref:Uncharacterized protein n=1 Tax=viral metagenome TaxID=1070528 RepID=A0A6C0I1T5_9ZZZZ
MSSFGFSIFDFNVQNYSNEELEDLLDLKKNYSANDIMSNKQKLCIQLASATGSIQTQSQMSDFLDAASKCLISTLVEKGKSSDKSSDKSSSSDKSDKYYFDPAHNFPKNTIIPGSSADGHFVIPDAYRMTQLDDYSNVSGLKIGEYGAPPGVINPVKYSTIVSSINIDSRFRPNYFNSKSTDLHITLPERIDNIVSYRLGSIEIPFYAIYAVSEFIGNNAIQIIWGLTPVLPATLPVYTDTFTIVIPDGNYYTTIDSTNVLASASIEKTINTILQSNTVSSSGGTGLSGILNYHIDQISGKSVFSQPAGATNIYFKVIVNVRSNGIPNYESPLLSFLGWNLGFRNAEYISNNNGSGNYGAVVSEALLAFKATSYIFIAIDDYNNSVNDYYSAVFSDSFAIKNVITRVNVGLLREISEASSTQLNRQRNFFGPVNIQKLRITLYDNFGRILDLNNMDWNMELIFECIYG